MQALITAVQSLAASFSSAFTKDGSGNSTRAMPSAVLAGTVPQNATSTAYETSRRVKAGPGVLLGFSGYNSKSTAQFILVFDNASNTVPANGAVPVAIITAPGAANFSYDPGRFGRRFDSGIWIANSSTAPTLTIGSADCFFDAQVN